MLESNVFAAVRDLVAGGEYRDEIPGAPGTRLSGSGLSRDDRRLYRRGSSEYLEARAAGLTDRLPPLSLASREAVERAEALIGCALPSLLRRLYLEVGNGGFGPSYGVLGVDGGHRDDQRRTATDLFRTQVLGSDGYWRGPSGTTLFPICHWGCAIYSFVDCASPNSRMWAWDPNPVPPDRLTLALFQQEMTLVEWLEQWVELRLNQPTLVEDQVTGQWRGATEAEYAAWAAELGAE